MEKSGEGDRREADFTAGDMVVHSRGRDGAPVGGRGARPARKIGEEAVGGVRNPGSTESVAAQAWAIDVERMEERGDACDVTFAAPGVELRQRS